MATALEFGPLPGKDGERERFLRRAAHELRAPIAAIAGYAQLCLGNPLVASDPELAEGLETIAECAEALERLVTELFDLMRLETTESIERTPVDLADTIAEAAGLVRPIAAEREIDLEVDVAPDLPVIAGDAVRMLGLVDHLLRNAMESTEAGGAVRVLARVVDDRIVIKVADTGWGIPGDEIPRLFSAFHRVSRADHPDSLGPGLGLAICRLIAEAHGGILSIESQESLGTVATVSVPF